MLETRQPLDTEIRKNDQGTDRLSVGRLSVDRPRKIAFQGGQGSEQSGGGVRNAMTVDAGLRVGILIITLAAVVMSTNVLDFLSEVAGSASRHFKSSVVVVSQSANFETLAPLFETKDPQEPWGKTHSSPANYKAAINRPCVRPEVYRSASDRSRFWWLLRDTNGRVMEKTPHTYESETEAYGAAGSAARTYAC